MKINFLQSEPMAFLPRAKVGSFYQIALIWIVFKGSLSCRLTIITDF